MYNGMDGFDWDTGNRTKNRVKHGVSVQECEEVFFNSPTIIYKDIRHSFTEKRLGILGKSNSGRKLSIIFTERDHKIRVITARDQNKKERIKYENKK
jgi:uncharacterized protein